MQVRAKSTLPDAEAGTLVDLLRLRAARQADTTAFIYIGDGDTETGRMNYGELDHRARAIAAAIQASIELAEPVLLLYPSGLHFIAAFFGCLYAGAVPVPAALPHPNRPATRLTSMVANAGTRLALTTVRTLESLKRCVAAAPELSAMRWLATDAIDAGQATGWQPPAVRPESLALLQYTSGSTGAARGVMVSHANLLHNQRLIAAAFGHSEKSVGMGWLPLFHDMGLVGIVLQAVFLGTTSALMSPIAFLQRPCRWLQAISRYRATTSGAPNFAYDLCVRKITPEQLAGVDLSSWDLAFVGAEPVRAATLAKFAAAFRPYGFDPRPCIRAMGWPRRPCSLPAA